MNNGRKKNTHVVSNGHRKIKFPFLKKYRPIICIRCSREPGLRRPLRGQKFNFTTTTTSAFSSVGSNFVSFLTLCGIIVSFMKLCKYGSICHWNFKVMQVIIVLHYVCDVKTRWEKKRIQKYQTVIGRLGRVIVAYSFVWLCNQQKW